LFLPTIHLFFSIISLTQGKGSVISEIQP